MSHWLWVWRGQPYLIACYIMITVYKDRQTLRLVLHCTLCFTAVSGCSSWNFIIFRPGFVAWYDISRNLQKFRHSEVDHFSLWESLLAGCTRQWYKKEDNWKSLPRLLQTFLITCEMWFYFTLKILVILVSKERQIIHEYKYKQITRK